MTDSRAALVIFDLDGTLADTLGDIAWAMDTVLASRGLPPHRLEEYRAFIGDGVEELVSRSLPAAQLALTPLVIAEFRRLYLAHMFDRTAPYPGVPELLDEVTARGIPMAVLSNKLEAATQAIVAHLFGRWRFAAAVGERPDVPRKPDPTAALAIAGGIGAAPARTLLCGDSGNDMETAVRAGMFPVGVLWGFRDRDDLLARGARAVISRPWELVSLFDPVPG